MTRAEYRISLRMWNYFLSTLSAHEILMCDRAWGSLGKALTHFQSIVASMRHTQKRVASIKEIPSLASTKAMTTMAFYKQLEKTMLYDTERRYRIEQAAEDGEEVLPGY